MKKIIDKLNFNIDEFKNNYWYSKTIEIPQFIKNIQPDIKENELFDKLLFNVFQTCDLFINQKMSQFLALDLTLEQIIEILGKQRVSNFISSVYTEIKYRLATEKFPEFSQKDKLITSNFSLATAGREFNNFQSLLSAEAIAYLSSPSWNDLKISDKDDYVNILEYVKTNNDNITNRLDKLNQFDSKIEKLLKDNSDSDENLKLSFSKFKSDQLEINDKKENKLSDNVRNFLNNNIESSDYLGPNDGDDYVKIVFNNDNLGVIVHGEEYQTYVHPGDVSVDYSSANIRLCEGDISFSHSEDDFKTKQTINYDKLKSIYENLDKTKVLETKLNSIDPALEKLNKFDSKIEKVYSDVENIIPRVSTIENLQSEQQSNFKMLSAKANQNEFNIEDIKKQIKNLPQGNNASLYENLKELFKCEEWEVEDKQNKTIEDFYEYFRYEDPLGNTIFKDKDEKIALSMWRENTTSMFFDFSNIDKFWIRDYPFIDDDKLEKELVKKQDKDLWINLKSDNGYSLINFSKEQAKIRFGANLSQGYISNFFFDRERDGRNIVRYIEKENETFLNLTPALQSDTHVEIGIKNSNKYISLKIDNEELLLDKTKLLKLKSLLS